MGRKRDKLSASRAAGLRDGVVGGCLSPKVLDLIGSQEAWIVVG
jgi:hypothetical protein